MKTQTTHSTTHKFLPMLAKPFAAKYLAPPVYAQPKLDGVRLIWDGKEAYSRSGKKIEGVPEIIAELKSRFAGFPLDGELYCHEMHFQRIVGCVRRKVQTDTDYQRIQFHVYDHPVAGVPFTERWARLKAALSVRKGVRHVVAVTTIPADLENPNPFAAAGYEGSMLRNGSAAYQFAHRSSDLLKVKTSIEEEFEIVGVTEKINYEKPLVAEGTPGAQRHTDGTFYINVNPKPAGVVGAISCVTATGERFDVGSGLSDAERKHYWDNRPIGKLCTVKFQELSLGGIPRFPTFKAVRDYE